MAKPLSERLSGALNTDRVTITDLRALITETQAERERHLGTAMAAERDSVDVMLADTARDAAADLLSRSTRMASGYQDVIGQLEAKLAAKLDGERRKAKAAEQADTLAERDALAEQWRKVWPEVASKLVGLFRDTLANDERLATCDLKNEPSAEAVARGLLRNFSNPSNGGGFVERLTQMLVPSLDSYWRLWPPYGPTEGDALRLQNELLATLPEASA